MGLYKNDMRWKIILIILFLCLLPESTLTQAQADPVDELIQRVNALRVAYGVPKYQIDYALMYAAQSEAEWGLKNNHFGHDGPGGSTPDDRAKAAGYGKGENSFAVENVAAGTASLNTPELVVTMWQNDWGHLRAMISPDYEHIGVGFSEADGFSYYVMMVGWVGSKASLGETQDQEIPVVDTSHEPFAISKPDESGAIYHEVQPGQAAWTIAAQYGIELAQLFELNNLTEDSFLHPGDVLMIQPPDPPTSTPTIKPTSIRSTNIPTQTSTTVQATEVPFESVTLADQDQEEVSSGLARSKIHPVLPVVGVGLVLLAIVMIVIWTQQRG